MNANINILPSHIAPCGMNCSLCIGFHRIKNKCDGCQSSSTNKPNHCINCSIKNCELLLNSESKFCFDCNIFPCKKIKNLDKRYKEKYGMSLIENLKAIKEIGLNSFILQEKDKWACSNCGFTICIHNEICLNCGEKRIIQKFN